MVEIDGGRLVARILHQEGVDYLYALSKEAYCLFFQGCLDEGIRVIDTRYEQAAVFMAKGWA